MISEKLAQFTQNLRYDDLPPQVVEKTKEAFLDWLGSAAAGAGKVPGKIMLEVVEELGGRPEATLISTGEKTSSILAALANGAASHIVELDDVHKASIIHAGAPIIPAALAAAEKVGAGGKALIEGIVAGYEVAIRIGEAITPSHYYYWHTTGTVGTFGACVAAGKILGLTKEELIDALGSAGTQAAGLWEFLADGAMSKHLHPGKAALNGLLSALLAQKGFTGAKRILEGEKGFIKATAPEFNLDKITNGLGQGYKILENSIKVHASCRHTHHAIDVVLDLIKENGLEPDMIDKIKVKTYPIAIDITGNFQPDSIYAGKFSLPFCLALAAKEKRAGLSAFSEETLFDPEIRSLMARVELVEDPELSALYPEKWPAAVEITDKEGGVYSGQTLYPKGDPENPVLIEELRDKFRELAGLHFSAESVEAFIEGIDKLEQTASMAEFLALGRRKEQ